MKNIEINLRIDYLVIRALEIAKIASHNVMMLYATQPANHNDSKIKLKVDESPITQADTLSHQIISEGLIALTPDIPIVSEEDLASLGHRQSDNTFWLIDPLDGTKEFISKNGEFTINIALINRGTAVLGVIIAPALELSYWGGTKIGAFQNRNGSITPIKVNEKLPCMTQPIRIVVSKSHLDLKTKEFILKFPYYELVQTGSSLKFCQIADQTAECYPRLGPTCEWDTAAGQAIIEAAGGYVETLDGQRLGYGKPNVINPSFVSSSMSLMNLMTIIADPVL